MEDIYASTCQAHRRLKAPDREVLFFPHTGGPTAAAAAWRAAEGHRPRPCDQDKASVHGTPELPTELTGALQTLHFQGLLLKLWKPP